MRLFASVEGAQCQGYVREHAKKQFVWQFGRSYTQDVWMRGQLNLEVYMPDWAKLEPKGCVYILSLSLTFKCYVIIEGKRQKLNKMYT